MRTEQAAPALGVVGCVATVVALVLPYLRYPSWGTELWAYYTAGVLGLAAAFYLVPVCLVALLAGVRGRADPTTAAGIALTLAVVTLVVVGSWGVSAPLEPLYGFPASWIDDHRWVVLGTTALVVVGSGLYARSVL
jgi:hypothetical protein